MNNLFLYWIHIKSMNISHYGFVCSVNFSNEKYIRVKKKKFLIILLRENRYQVFVSYLGILPIWRILFLFLLASFGIHKLFLFLFIQNLAPRIYSYSYSREKLLFTDHWMWFFWNKAGFVNLDNIDSFSAKIQGGPISPTRCF